MSIRETRIKYGIKVEEAAKSCGIPLRTYQRYEKDEGYGSALKRKAILDILKEKNEITEDNGILSIEDIKKKCQNVFDAKRGEISFCYLFGSYAKGYAKGDSDVDLLISSQITGFDFLEIIEELRSSLCKKIDLLRLTDQKDNLQLIDEIMKDGIKIYG